MNPDVYQGFVQATQPLSLMATAIGSLLGLIVGMIPGMTISATGANGSSAVTIRTNQKHCLRRITNSKDSGR